MAISRFDFYPFPKYDSVISPSQNRAFIYKDLINIKFNNNLIKEGCFLRGTLRIPPS